MSDNRIQLMEMRRNLIEYIKNFLINGGNIDKLIDYLNTIKNDEIYRRLYNMN